MFSIRSILALLFVVVIACVSVSAAPNRVLMRFGKRSDDLYIPDALYDYKNDPSDIRNFISGHGYRENNI